MVFLNFFNPLPRACFLALGKEIVMIFFKKIFAEGYCLGPRQRTLACRGPWSLPSAKRQKFNFFFVFCIPSTQAFHIYISTITYIYIYHTEPIFSQYITTIIVNHKSQYITTSHMFIIIHMFITTSS